MPELPEVETIRRDLARVLKGRRIVGFKIVKLRLLRNSPPLFRRGLTGATILSVGRRAKLLLLELSSGYVLAIHLKMTGQLVWRSPSGQARSGGHPIMGVAAVPNKFTYITINLSDGAKLYFNDVRQFGYWQLIPKQEMFQHTHHYGPEPLSADFSSKELAARLAKHRRTSIKAALLNQTVVAGLGNIYADESLFMAKLRPQRRVATLKPQELSRLRRAIQSVLKKAVGSRGTSFNTYVDALGRSGTYWQSRLVYGRAGEPCLICRTTIKRVVAVGRGTHYCAHCQH